MDLYTFTIEMDEGTVERLREGNFTLFGLHAVATSAQGTPAIWLSAHYLERQTRVTWHESYSLFTSSTTEIVPGARVAMVHNYPAELGNVLTVTGNSGSGGVAPGAPAGHLSIVNRAGVRLAAGVCVQDTHDEYHPCGLFEPAGADLFQPLPRAAFFFSPIPHMPGELVEKAISAGVMVDFAGTPDNSRTIAYSFDDGWDRTERPWSGAIAAGEPLGPLLTARSTVLRALAMQREHTPST